MKPDSKYTFLQSPGAHTRYRQVDHYGEAIPEFPAVFLRNCPSGKAGEKYVCFRPTVHNRPGHRYFSHSISLEGNRMVTGVNFTPEFPRRAFGDYKGNALLIEFSTSWEELTIWFFRGQKEAAQSLFQLWVSGELPEVTTMVSRSL